jgi:hypothetical protein
MIYPELSELLYHGSTVQVSNVDLSMGTYGDPLSPDARNTAIRLLNTTKLYNQVFFGTKKAVSCLKFLEVFEIGIN